MTTEARLRIVRCHPSRLDALVAFVAAHNGAPEHHIGYFGLSADDVRQSILMLNLRYDRGFRLALRGNHLVGVLGVDFDREIGRAWLYGPLVIDADWAAVADALYDAARQGIPAGIVEQQLFIDAANQNGGQFAARHGFHEHGAWAIYGITPQRMDALPAAAAEPWDAAYADQLAALHDELFPGSNYTLSYMLSELAKGGILWLLTDNGRLAGYFFGRAEPESGEAYVDLLGVAADYRRQGLGRQLVLAGLSALRPMPGLRQVSLSVAAGNEAAMNLYDALGFIKERDMVAWQKRDE
ncbi:protein of unknown function [Candidatus Promineifilum breve]|uniref:N-acetyltransferase domain-containing protein n=1 Tax=Candidatus Promineifilum breve TaxID=1806508 RepID=A0A160T9W3_9CHLR|nr:N-acetyltransferase [Candidatus Promineifilum breve]CUS05860.1 protein of unknown function [Candidatus Promineifilum breve]